MNSVGSKLIVDLQSLADTAPLKMAEQINLESIDDQDKEFIQTVLDLPESDGQCFDVDDVTNTLYLPFAFARDTFELERREVQQLRVVPVFSAILRENQTRVRNQALAHMTKSGCVTISAHPGFGKTILAVNIACTLGLKTAVVVNKVVLVNQWAESIANFSTAKCAIATPKKPFDEMADILIVNAINVQKWPRSFWSSIKLLIVDELHQIVTKVLTKSLLWFTPDRVLGLSATPFRFDEYNKAIPWFFGKSSIVERLNVQHTVFVFETKFKPRNLIYTRQGLDWNAVLNEQSENDARNRLIVRIVTDKLSAEPSRTWLILVKRVAHADTLVELFKERGVTCSTLLGSAVAFDKTNRVLIGTTSKIGVGFDHAAIDSLCIASDVKQYFTQFLGRCMRRPDARPLVVDFRDDMKTLEKHLDERIRNYREHGGTVEEIAFE